MARTYTVQSARKAQTCRVCGKAINVGDPYKWTKPRYKGKIAACPNCTIPLSMTSSSKMVAVYEAVDALNRSDHEGVTENLRMLAETVREVGGEYQESAENQQQYFPDSEVAAENEDKAQQLDSWADDIDSAADEAESELSELEELQEEHDNSETSEERIAELEGEIESKQEEILAHLDVAEECPV